MQAFHGRLARAGLSQHAPTTLSIGPVLDQDDAVANEVGALDFQDLLTDGLRGLMSDRAESATDHSSARSPWLTPLTHVTVGA